jgi:hypothetical protein
MNRAIEFNAISDLSFHIHATINHPLAPISERIVSKKLDPSEALIAIAVIKTKEENHLIYQDSLSLGVVPFNPISNLLNLLISRPTI